MTPKFKRAALPAGAAGLVFLGLARWLIWLMPPPHRPFEYMIAGTAATAVTLGALFARLVMNGSGAESRFAFGPRRVAACQVTPGRITPGRITPGRTAPGSAPPF